MPYIDDLTGKVEAPAGTTPDAVPPIVLSEDLAMALAVEAKRAGVSAQQYTEFVIGVGLGALSKMREEAEKEQE